MAVSSLVAAKRLCKTSGWSITNLELQKLLYIAHMFHLGETGDLLVTGHFEAWDYGPVMPNVYQKAKVFGRSPVGKIFNLVADIDDESPEASTLDSAVRHLGNAAPGRLVAITHWDGGAWAKHYSPGDRNRVIPNEDILQEYKDRVNAVQQQR